MPCAIQIVGDFVPYIHILYILCTQNIKLTQREKKFYGPVLCPISALGHILYVSCNLQLIIEIVFEPTKAIYRVRLS